MSQLKKLKLCGCRRLTSLPDTLGNLVQLQDLCLGGCADLKCLPSTFGNLAKLQKLDLQRCRGLRTLPNTIDDLEELKYLNLRDCSGLQRLPHTVAKLQKLKLIILEGCSGLGSFYHTVVKLAQLRESNRSAGLRSLAQKKFNVYLTCAADAAEEGETLMGNLHKCVRICWGREDEQGRCTESLRICRNREDDQSGDIRRAIESSDILIPVVSLGYYHSDWGRSEDIIRLEWPPCSFLSAWRFGASHCLQELLRSASAIISGLQRFVIP